MSFWGREEERRRVRDLLSTRGSAPFVVHVQGMPGIGKSALLEQLSLEAAQLGYTVHTVPRELGGVERAQELQTHLAQAQGKTLLVVDDWHKMGLAEPSLVDWLEASTAPVALLLASRLRPRPAFVESALFPGRLFVLELGGLPLSDSLALLEAHGTPPSMAREIYHVTAGQPFAMLLLGASPTLWEAVGPLRRSIPPELSESVAVTLVQRLVGQIQAPLPRDALTMVALAGSLNERELRTAFGLAAPEASSIFDRLRELTVVRTTTTGLELHPIVRSAILADLHLRDPQHARVLASSVLGPIEEALAWSGIPRDRALRQLRDLAAAAPQDVALSGMFEFDDPRVTQPRARDMAEALALVEALEGQVAREIAQRWVTFDPASVTIVRSGDRLDGVMIRTELRGRHVPPPLSEPAVDRLVEVLGSTGELRPGKLLRTTRFFLAREHHQMPCAQLAALGAAITRRTLETYEPFFSVQHLDARAVEPWRAMVATMGFRMRDEAAATVDGRLIVPCVADFADLGVVFSGVVRRSWGVEPLASAPPPELQSEPLPEQDLEEEVLQALRHMRDLVWLQDCVLGARLFPGPSERAEGLHRWLEQAVADTENMRHGDLVSRALRACFGASRSAEEAATFAGMGLSTLKRYRKMGVQHITALAQREIMSSAGSAAPKRAPPA